MAEKKISAIQEVTLNTATFENETFAPTYINFFFGKNGAGKTSLGRQLGEGVGLHWAEGESPANYEIHLYNQDFIDQHFRTLDRLRGVFSLSEGKETEEAEKRIEELEARRKVLEKRKVEIEGEGGEREKTAKAMQSAQSNFEKACLNSTKLFRDKFKQAFRGATRNPQLSQKINSTAPRDCDVDELEKRYLAAFAEGARMYPYFTELDGDDHIAAIPTCELLGEVIRSKGTTEYARFIRDIGALAWIEEGHQKYHDAAKGACPYCAQKLPADYESFYASCFDDEYQRKIKTIRAFPEIYTRHFAPVYEILKKVTEATDVLRCTLGGIPGIAERNPVDECDPPHLGFLLPRSLCQRRYESSGRNSGKTEGQVCHDAGRWNGKQDSLPSCRLHAMEYLQNQLTTHTYSGASRKITAKSPRVAQMLNNELDTISSAIALVDNYISILNNHCNNRYKWNDVKSKLVFQHFEGSSI